MYGRFANAHTNKTFQTPSINLLIIVIVFLSLKPLKQYSEVDLSHLDRVLG